MDTILSALYSAEADQAEIDDIMARLAPRAEREVPGWESDPHLLSDQTYPMGAGAETLTVTLPILGGEYFWSYLLPRVEEWVTGVYGGDALQVLQQAALNPLAFLLDLARKLLRRPNSDALKVSFLEACAYTLTTTEAEVTARFYAKCPMNQQFGVIRKLVETNRANFIEWLEGLPTPLKQTIYLFRLTSIQSFEILNAQIIGLIQQQTALLLSGGVGATGTEGSGLSQEEKQLTSS